MTRYKIPRYRVRLVREAAATYRAQSPNDAAAILRSLCCERGDREVMAVLYLDIQNGVVGCEVVAVGAATHCATDVSSVLRGAIVAGARGIILGHNHPSGDPSPSPDDARFTAALNDAAKIVGVPLIDHVIVTEHGWSYSFLDQGHAALGAP